MESIFKLNQNKKATKISVINGYELPGKESFYQELVKNNPELLKVQDINREFGDICFIGREVSLPVGNIDDLFISSSGAFVVVETKLYDNHTSKREVLSQVLDYASCICDLNYEELINTLSNVLKQDFYNYLISEKFISSKNDFEKKVKRNLTNNRIMVIIAGDEIRDNVVTMANFFKTVSKEKLNIGLVNINIFKLNDEMFCFSELSASTRKLDKDYNGNYTSQYGIKLQVSEFVNNFTESQISRKQLDDFFEEARNNGLIVRCASKDCFIEVEDPQIKSTFAFIKEGFMQYRRSYIYKNIIEHGYDKNLLSILDNFFEELSPNHSQNEKSYWTIDTAKLYENKEKFFETVKLFIENLR